MLFLLLMILLRAAYVLYRFHSWPLGNLQILFPAILIGVLLLVNWSLRGLAGQLLGGLLGLGAWYLACAMLPWITWPIVDLPRWIVYSGLGFSLLSFGFVSVARAGSRLRLRLHGREWILRHLRGECFYRRFDAQQHLNGLGLMSG